MEIPELVYQEVRAALAGVQGPYNGNVELRLDILFKSGGFAGVKTMVTIGAWKNAKEVEP